MPGQLEVIDDATHAQGNRLGALEPVAYACGRLGDPGQLSFGGLQQRLAFAAALLGQQRIATHDESLAGERVTRHLKQVALIEQRRLEGSLLAGERGHLRRAQAAHPVQPGRAQQRVDAGLREHASVAHPGERVDPVTVFELLDLRRYGRRIGGVAGEDFDRHRDALRRADQPEHDLRVVTLAIAAVAVRRELAAASGHPCGSEVVEHQRTTGQMLAGEALLDARLSLSQPVSGFPTSHAQYLVGSE